MDKEKIKAAKVLLEKVNKAVTTMADAIWVEGRKRDSCILHEQRQRITKALALLDDCQSQEPALEEGLKCLKCGKSFPFFMQEEFTGHILACTYPESQAPDHIPEVRKKVGPVSEFVKGIRFELVYREIAKVNNLFDKAVLEACDRLETEAKQTEQARGVAFRWQQIAQERKERADAAEKMIDQYYKAVSDFLGKKGDQ